METVKTADAPWVRGRYNGGALGMRNTGRTNNACVRVAAHGFTVRARFRISLPQGQASSLDPRASCRSIPRRFRNRSCAVARLRRMDSPSACDWSGSCPGGDRSGVAVHEVNWDSATRPSGSRGDDACRRQPPWSSARVSDDPSVHGSW